MGDCVRLFLGGLLLLISLSSVASEIDDWHVNVGLGFEYYQDPVIQKSALRGSDRIVVTQESYQASNSLWLTLNWNIFPTNLEYLNKGVISVINQDHKVKYGIFAGVKLVDSVGDSSGAFGFGPQVSFLLGDRVMSLGGGLVMNKIKTYADGISSGSPLPTYYDDIELEESIKPSYLVMFSVGL